MNSNIKQFDVVLVDFGDNTIGSEQGGIRNAVVIQNDMGNKHSSTTIVMPFTTRIKNVMQPTHSFFKANRQKGLAYDSMLLGECMRQISEDRIIKSLGRLSSTEDKLAVKRAYEANWGGDYGYEGCENDGG